MSGPLNTVFLNINEDNFEGKKFKVRKYLFLNGSSQGHRYDNGKFFKAKSGSIFKSDYIANTTKVFSKEHYISEVTFNYYTEVGFFNDRKISNAMHTLGVPIVIEDKNAITTVLSNIPSNEKEMITMNSIDFEIEKVSLRKILGLDVPRKLNQAWKLDNKILAKLDFLQLLVFDIESLSGDAVISEIPHAYKKCYQVKWNASSKKIRGVRNTPFELYKLHGWFTLNGKQDICSTAGNAKFFFTNNDQSFRVFQQTTASSPRKHKSFIIMNSVTSIEIIND